MFDYETLRVLWWAILGVLLMGIAVMDGFDLGSAILLPILGKSDAERRVIINTVGPVWEGNQVWFVLGGGAVFAAWPPLYGVAFSGFYLAMLLLLLSLILRPVGFKFRSKIDNETWRNVWDCALFISGLVPALVFGVAFGNVLQGVPFRFDQDLRMTYEGSLWDLFNPFALLAGLVSVAMITMHGASWLSVKTVGVLRDRARRAGAIAALATVVLFVAAGFWASQILGYALTSAADGAGPSNPLLKTVVRAPGALLANYSHHPWTIAAPVLGIGGAGLAAIFARIGRSGLAFICSALSIIGIIATAGVSLFPFLLPSSLDPNSSLLVWDASSSRTTLLVMTAAVALFLPLILAYTTWVYWVLRGPVRTEDVVQDPYSY